jgi:hypothetical protein
MKESLIDAMFVQWLEFFIVGAGVEWLSGPPMMPLILLQCGWLLLEPIISDTQTVEYQMHALFCPRDCGDTGRSFSDFV